MNFQESLKEKKNDYDTLMKEYIRLNLEKEKDEKVLI